MNLSKNVHVDGVLDNFVYLHVAKSFKVTCILAKLIYRRQCQLPLPATMYHTHYMDQWPVSQHKQGAEKKVRDHSSSLFMDNYENNSNNVKAEKVRHWLNC